MRNSLKIVLAVSLLGAGVFFTQSVFPVKKLSALFKEISSLARLHNLALPLGAVTISNVTVDNISYSTARIQWNSNVPTSGVRVMYDSLTSTLPFANSTQLKQTGAPQTTLGFTLGGLAPGTKYYFVPCSTVSGVETCGNISSFTTLPAPANPHATPALPNAPVLLPMPTINGQTFTVAADCSNMQSIINQAAAITGAANHQILISPSTVCKGNYKLPARAGSGWIVVRTSTPDSQLPPEGSRITPAYTSLLPTLSSVNTYVNALDGVFYINENPSSKWRFVGLKFTGQSGYHSTLFTIGYEGANIVIDRNIFFSDKSNGETVLESIQASGSQIVIANSYIYNVRPGDLALAIDITSAKGILIDNNYINAPGISVFAQEFGNVVQGSDYKITRNYFEWDKAYINNSITRHQIEFKSGNRILIDGNTFTSMWAGGITGSISPSILFSPRNGWPGSPSFDNYIADVTLTNNVFYDVPGGIALSGSQNSLAITDLASTKRILIQNNLFYNVNGYLARTGVAASGIPFFFGYSLEDVVVNHNTVFNPRGIWPYLLGWNSGPGSGIKFSNNIFTSNYSNGYGNLVWTQDSSRQLPVPTLNNTTPVPTFRGFTSASPNPDSTSQFINNLIIPGVIETDSVANYDNPSKSYSVANCTSYWSNLPSNPCAGNSSTDTANKVFASVGFTGPFTTIAGFKLSSGSAYKNVSNDGTDPGINVDAILAAQTSSVALPPVPADTTAPILSSISTSALTQTGATITWTTNENADTQVEYGLISAYGSVTPLDTSISTSHQVSLSSLQPNTVYNYRVKSRDVAGNLSTGSNQLFTTVAVITVAPTGSVSLNTSTGNFGSLPVNTVSDAIMFTVNNTTANQVGISNVQTTGDYAVSTNYCNYGAQPNTHCDVFVTFRPTVSGTRNGTLAFNLTGASVSSLQVTLTGTGTSVNIPVIPPPSTPQASTSPSVPVPYTPGTSSSPGVSSPIGQNCPTVPVKARSTTGVVVIYTGVCMVPSGWTIISDPSNTISNTSSVKVTLTAPLYRGITHPEVSLLQEFLKKNGLLSTSIQTSTYYGPATEASVKKYQASQILEQTGAIGPLTRSRISGGRTASFTNLFAIPTPSTPSTASTFNPGRALSYGMKGDDVAALQRILRRLGYLSANQEIMGSFDVITRTAVRSFQRVEGIVSSGTAATTGYGMVGKKTAAALAKK